MPIAVLYSMMLSLALKSICVLAGAWVVAWFMRRRSAAMRHLVWSIAFGGLLALPMLSVVLPALRIPVSEQWSRSGFLFKTEARGSSELASRQTAPSNSSSQTAGSAAVDWRLLLLLIWAAGSALSLARMLMGWAAVERVRSHGRTLAAPELGAGVTLLEVEAGSMPMTCGLVRPVILMPRDARQWSEERRRVVLRHEMAHIRRGDSATHVMARAALSLYWWNPLAWMGWREFLKDRERAADDLVLGQGEGRAAYARHLLEIARGMQIAEAGWPVVAMASISQLETRVAAILDSGRDRRAPRRFVLVAASIVAAAMLGPLAAMQVKAGTTVTEVGQAGEFAGDMRAKKLMTSADQQGEAGKFEQAKTLYSDALNLSPTLAVAYLHRGIAELALKDYAGALSDFEKGGTVDPAYAGESKMWMAITQQQQGNADVADALYQTAIAAGGPQSAATATTLELYAQFLDTQDKSDEAKSTREKAAEIRKALVQNPASVAEAEAYKMGGDVQPPILLSKVEPNYTEEARVAHYSGTVLLSTVIGEDGAPIGVRVIRGLGFGLDQKAIEAVNQWKFKPGSKDGNAVPVKATIEVKFRLL